MSDRPSAPNYIGTRVTLESVEGLVVHEAQFPAPKIFTVVDKPISTFFGDLDVRVPIEVAADAAPGERVLKGSVRYQACTEASCLFPVTRPFETRVRVVTSPGR